MLFVILLTAQIIICVAMVGLILIQRSEGGALGMGGGPNGFMSARGAGNLLTRATAIMAFLFFANSIALTFVGQMQTKSTSVIDQVGVKNLILDKSKLPDPSQEPQAQSQSSQSAQPSLSQLPLPSAQLTPTQAPVSQAPVSQPKAQPKAEVSSTIKHLSDVDAKLKSATSSGLGAKPTTAPSSLNSSSAASQASKPSNP